MSFLSKLIPRRLLSAAERQDKSGPWETTSEAELRQKLLGVMRLYRFLTHEQQGVLCEFVRRFYTGKEVFIHPSVNNVEQTLLAVAANAALVGAAQKTHYFATVKWVYLCADDLEVDGDAFASSTVRINSELCLDESQYPRPGSNLVVHEFSHILDSLLGLSGSTQGLRDGFTQYIQDIQKGNWLPIADCFTDIDDIDLVPDDIPQSAFHTEIEFFAAASEAFFTNADQLKAYHRPLYNDLSLIYGLDLAELNWREVYQE